MSDTERPQAKGDPPPHPALPLLDSLDRAMTAFLKSIEEWHKALHSWSRSYNHMTTLHVRGGNDQDPVYRREQQMWDSSFSLSKAEEGATRTEANERVTAVRKAAEALASALLEQGANAGVIYRLHQYVGACGGFVAYYGLFITHGADHGFKRLPELWQAIRTALVAELVRVGAGVGRPGGPKPAAARDGPSARTKPTKGKGIEARMLKMLTDRQHEVVGWSAEAWAEALGCAPSTVKETRVWKDTLRGAKALLRAQRADQKSPKRGRRAN